MAAHEQRLTVYRPVLWRGIKRQEWFGDNTVWFPGADDHHIFGCFFRTEGFYGIDILRIDPTGPGLHWARRGATPTVSFPYDGAHGDGASCMINMLVAMMGELYSLTEAKDAYELVMGALLKDTSQQSAVRVAAAMISVAPMGDVLRAVAAAKAKVAPSA